MAIRAKETKTKPVRKATRKPQPFSRLNASGLFKNKKVLAFLVLAFILVLVLIYFFKGLFIASIVNGEPISRISVIRALEKQAGRETLDRLITKKLIFQEAKKRNVIVTRNDIDTEIKKIEENVKTQGSTLDQALAAQGMTRNQLNEEIKIQLSIQKMVYENVKLTDKEINEFIEKNKDQFPENTTEQQMKTEAANQLKQQKQQEETQKFIQDLQKRAKIIQFVQY